MGNYIKMKRFFTISDYEEEEQFLRQQHKKGLRFVKTNYLGTYFFEPCEAEDVIYQLDYDNSKRKDNEEYLQIFADAGWEYVISFNGWNYFRKAAANADGDQAIFTDSDSKLEMISQIFNTRMIPLIVIFLAILVPQLIMNYSRVMEGEINGFRIVILLLYVILFVIYLIMFVHCGRGLARLRKRETNE